MEGYMTYEDVKNELEASKELLTLQISNCIGQSETVEIIQTIFESMKPEDILPINHETFLNNIYACKERRRKELCQ